ncbi:peptidoglycan editing factor PgeF [Bacillus tuaregi]|uniref:peptidoglycan editing factor PgeF n=1 Tax=Bacillus tuaregi TaxID=1816695 RepID=UPI0008F8FFA2|nr:peptidoglycan editing factor PgeF [Bacillus tuaregi]
MDPFVLKEKEYYVLNDWVQRFPNLTAGFTTKNEGKSSGVYHSLNVGFHVNDSEQAVYENRLLLANKLDYPLNTWVGGEQTHDINIKKVTEANKGKGAASYDDAFKQTDGFFTYTPGILLTLCFADCVPLYFIHPDSGAVGIAHAGWKGTVNGIAEEMISVFRSEGLNLNDIFVAIGPSICENCYIVDDRVIKLVENRLEDVEIKPYNLISGNQYKLDLKECNKEILLKAGLPKKNILITKLCTSCQKEQFYSHRRDQGKTGRMMSFIGWKEAIL